MLRLKPHEKDLGDGFVVRRLLPAASQRSVGPFVFFDHMGPVELPPGRGLDVRPHPHIGLATVTYLFEGAITHRDNLGHVIDIRPGAVNWMVAGRGIVHSERTPAAERARGQRVHGIQTWVALPLGDEAVDPGFTHVPADQVPRLQLSGGCLSVVAGDAFGLTSPVPVRSRTLYVAAELDAGTTFELPAEHPERAVYVAAGALRIDGEPLGAGDMLVLSPDRPVELRSLEPTLAVILGGEPLDAPRFMVWNFVSSSRERLEQAQRDWAAQDKVAFPKVPGESEWIPLP